MSYRGAKPSIHSYRRPRNSIPEWLHVYGSYYLQLSRQQCTLGHNPIGYIRREEFRYMTWVELSRASVLRQIGHVRFMASQRRKHFSWNL